jgi:hypothetical protein
VHLVQRRVQLITHCAGEALNLGGGDVQMEQGLARHLKAGLELRLYDLMHPQGVQATQMLQPQGKEQ